MTLSEYLKPALAAVAVIALGGGWYWFEHRSRSEPTETPSKALVIVAKATNACFSDLVRVTGFIVPRREAVAGVEQEGFRVGRAQGRRYRCARRRPASSPRSRPRPARQPRRRPGRCSGSPSTMRSNW